MDIYIRDWDDNAPEGVFDLWDYRILCEAYGSSVSWSFTVGANVGFEKEPITAGADLSGTWTYSETTDILAHTYSNGHWKTVSNYYHLGRVEVDLFDNYQHNAFTTVIVLLVSVSNANAPTYKYNHYTFYLRVKQHFGKWSLFNTGGGHTIKTITFPYLGDGSPSTTDAKLYLLEASDYSGVAK